MKVTRRALLGASLATAALAATGCKKKSSHVNSKVIKLGVNYELSGEVATYGQSCLAGIELAVDEINDAGGIKGKKIELVKYDNKSDSAEATTLEAKLLSSDKVLAAMGPATSSSFKAVIPVATKTKVPIVSCSGTADDLTYDKHGVKEYAFRICFNDSFQGRIMAKFASEKLKARTAVIIKDNSNDYSKGLAAAFAKDFKGKIVGEEGYVAKDQDFNAILTRLKGKSFDIIYLPGYYNEAGLIIKQARTLGITAPILGGDGFDSPTLLELAGASALNNVYFTNHYSAVDKDPKVVKFIKTYKEKKHAEPNAFNTLGYDMAKFVASAVERANEFTPEAVKNAMAKTKGFSGITGTLDIDDHHNPIKSIVVITLKDGKQSSSEKISL